MLFLLAISLRTSPILYKISILNWHDHLLRGDKEDHHSNIEHSIIQKVPETVIHLKVDEEQWGAQKKRRGRWAEDAPKSTYRSTAPECSVNQSRS